MADIDDSEGITLTHMPSGDVIDFVKTDDGGLYVGIDAGSEVAGFRLTYAEYEKLKQYLGVID